MIFIPKEVDHSVNAPAGNPLAELFKLSLSLAVIIFAVYMVLGWFVDLSVRFMSPAQEQRLSKIAQKYLPASGGSSAQQAHLQKIADDLAEKGGMPPHPISIIESLEPNAFAYPSGHIVVTSAFLREAGSENELAMVLGHELGHLKHRDHLRALGRGLLLALVLMPITQSDSGVDRFVQFSLSQAHSRYSQAQEQAADALGFELTVKRYGHAGGVTDFFARMKIKEKWWVRWMGPASHPASSTRIAALQRRIQADKVPIGPLTPYKPQ